VRASIAEYFTFSATLRGDAELAAPVDKRSLVVALVAGDGRSGAGVSCEHG
jgi:hypothetical protein